MTMTQYFLKIFYAVLSTLSRSLYGVDKVQKQWVIRTAKTIVAGQQTFIYSTPSSRPIYDPRHAAFLLSNIYDSTVVA